MKCLIHPRLSEAINRTAGSKALAAASHLFVSVLYLKSVERDDSRYFVPLHSKLLRRVYTTRHYGPMMKLLAALKAVETYKDGSYLAGDVSKRYRLSLKYASGVVPIAIDAPLLEKRMEDLMDSWSFAAMTGPARGWIVSSYRRASFGPNIETALASHANDNPASEPHTRLLVETVSAHRMRFHVSSDSGRVYYSVANLPKMIRAQLLLDGQEVVEIDASASQPTLLATLYPGACKERDHYLDVVQNQDIYTIIAGWAGAGWDRDRAKTEFFNQIAYGSYYNAEKYPLLPIFRKRFPQLTRRMAAIKKAGNRVLPLRMQKVEADITVNGACGECATRRIPVLPVHDSLLCRANDADEVRALLRAHWRRVTGIPVKLRNVSDHVRQEQAVSAATTPLQN